MQILTNLNLNKNELQNTVIQNLATPPISPKSGLIYYNTTDNTYYGWNGSKWIVKENVQADWNQTDSLQDNYIQNKPSLSPSNADKTETAISGATVKTTLADADTLPLSDSASSNAIKKISFANLKTVLKNLF